MEIAEDHLGRTEHNARKLGQLETEVVGIKGDIGQIRADVKNGFDSVFAKMDRVTAPKATPWGAVAVLLTTLTGLAAWANSWISQGITAASDKAAQAGQRATETAARLDGTITRLTDHQIAEAERRGATAERLRWIEDGKLIDSAPARATQVP